jgi:hypothetical protein
MTEGEEPGRQPAPASPDSELRRVLTAVASLVGLVGYIYLIGWLVSWVRYAAARLPSDVMTALLSDKQLFGVGLRATALMAVVFAGMCVLASLASGLNWAANGPDWHAVVINKGVGEARRKLAESPKARTERDARRAAASRRSPKPAKAARTPPQAPLGDWVVRIVAGFNIVVISAVAGLAAARVVEWLFPHAWWAIVGVWVLVLSAWTCCSLIGARCDGVLGPTSLRLCSRAWRRSASQRRSGCC